MVKQSYCKDCKAELNRMYFNNNPDRRIKRTRSENLKRYYSDRLHQNVARIIRIDLKGGKNRRTFEALGYSIQDLKLHLESLFQEGMTWENYGEWHIDHIIPRSKLPFKSMDDENFRKCWSLKNLQPLWKADNLMKSNKLLEAA